MHHLNDSLTLLEGGIDLCPAEWFPWTMSKPIPQTQQSARRINKFSTERISLRVFTHEYANSSTPRVQPIGRVLPHHGFDVAPQRNELPFEGVLDSFCPDSDGRCGSLSLLC
jgi:hypothetical protein